MRTIDNDNHGSITGSNLHTNCFNDYCPQFVYITQYFECPVVVVARDIVTLYIYLLIYAFSWLHLLRF